MNIFGWFLAVVGVVLAIGGVLRLRKMKKMNAVPFRRPAEILQQGAQAADAKGMISTEGQVNAGPQPLIAPMSGQPCLAYELTVERKWEKQVQTEKGVEKKTGTDKIHTDYRGATFQLTDGAGAVLVDASERPDADMDKGHASTISVGLMIPGTLTFGQLQMNTPAILSTEGRTTAFVGTEKLLKASPTMYALGQVAQGPHGLAIGTPKGLGTGKLILSNKGREALLKKTKLHMTLAFAFGGVFAFGGTTLGVFGPKAESTSCASLITGDQKCDDRVSSAAGASYTWTVTKPGTYAIKVTAPKVKYPLYANVALLNASHDTVAEEHADSRGDEVVLKTSLAAGTYTLNVTDRFDADVSGGFSFKLDIASLGGAAPTPATAGSAIAVAGGDAGAVEIKNPVKVMGATVAANAKGAVKPAAAAVKPATPAAQPKKP